MRFAAVIRPLQKQSVRTPASDFVRRIMSGEMRSPTPSKPSRPEEVPLDLDQRVRLAGEW